MTAAIALAGLAGVVAAAGIGELAADGWVGSGGRLGRGRMRSLLLALGRRVGGPAPPRDLAERLDGAGAGLAVADAMAFKAGAGLTAGLLGLMLAASAPGRLGLVLPAAAAAAGFLALDAWLVLRTRRRMQAVAVELPDVIDLLRVGLEAGLAPVRALEEVGRRHHGVLASELAHAAARCAVGVTRREALDRLRRRAPAEGVAAVTTVLERADRLGAPPAEELAALARDAREGRARARSEAAARAAPKIQLIVALLLVPSVMLLITAALAPALLETI